MGTGLERYWSWLVEMRENENVEDEAVASGQNKIWLGGVRKLVVETNRRFGTGKTLQPARPRAISVTEQCINMWIS